MCLCNKTTSLLRTHQNLDIFCSSGRFRNVINKDSNIVMVGQTVLYALQTRECVMHEATTYFFDKTISQKSGDYHVSIHAKDFTQVMSNLYRSPRKRYVIINTVIPVVRTKTIPCLSLLHSEINKITSDTDHISFNIQ